MVINETTEYDEPRRDFIIVATGAMSAIGAAAATWPFIDSMNPSADLLSVATIEVDLSPMEVGQRITVMWRGKPIFVERRASQIVSQMEAVDLSKLPDPETDGARTIKDERR